MFHFRRQPELKDVSGNSIEVNTVAPLRSYSSSTLSPASMVQYGPVPTTYRPRSFSLTTPSPYDDGYSANSNYLTPGYELQAPYVSPYRNSYPHRVQQPAMNIQPPNFDENQLQAAQVRQVNIAPAGVRGYRPANNTINTRRFSRYRPEIARLENFCSILRAVGNILTLSGKNR